MSGWPYTTRPTSDVSDASGLDAHHDELKTKGVEIMDTPGGTTWKVAPPPTESA